MELRIGRDPEWASHEMNITEPTVSRRHCTLTECANGKWMLTNISRNGTFVNGSMVNQMIVSADDIIQLGPAFSVRLSDLFPQIKDTEDETVVNYGYHQPQPAPQPQYTPQQEYQSQQSSQQQYRSTSNSGSMGLGGALSSVFSNYATFSGRARRSEYWWFALVQGTINVVLYFSQISALSSGDYGTYQTLSTMMIIVTLGLFIPALAVTVRRLHDTGRSGWNILWGLIPLIGIIIVLVFTLQDSERGTNQYGPSPKE